MKIANLEVRIIAIFSWISGVIIIPFLTIACEPVARPILANWMTSYEVRNHESAELYLRAHEVFAGIESDADRFSEVTASATEIAVFRNELAEREGAAIALLERAASAGMRVAAFELALFYADGSGFALSEDDLQCKRWMDVAVRGGYPTADYGRC